MKILLTAVNAKFIHSNPAVYSLRAYASEWAENVGIAEYTINQTKEQILADLYERRPDVIAFSCYIWNWRMIRSLLAELPKVLPETELWLGGPEVSYDAPKVLRELPQVSGVMVGEGEATFADLCEYWTTGRPAPASVPGLCLPGSGYTAPRAPVDLNDVPFLYDDLSAFDNRIIYYETSRGCPFRCSYCLSSAEKTLRFRTGDRVFRELDFFLRSRVPQVKFIDRTFNCDHEHCLAVWRYLAEHDNGVTNFHFEIAADLLNEEELRVLGGMRPGLVQLEIGVQSTNPATLRAIRRGTDLRRLTENVRRLRETGNIHIHLDLIAGLPEEDLPTFRKSFNDVYMIGCDDLQLGFLKVLKGSRMAEAAEEYGLRYMEEPPYEVLSTKWLGYGDLLELKSVERMLEAYHNSCQYPRTVRLLEEEYGDPYRLYLELAEYNRAKGYEENRPSREERFRVLLGFASERRPERAALYREALTFDAYARENCKKRPDFATDASPYRERILELNPCREAHTEPFFYRVWEDGPKTRAEEPVFVTFDYTHRDPVTNNAALRVWENG